MSWLFEESGDTLHISAARGDFLVRFRSELDGANRFRWRSGDKAVLC
jgi:hypothetical protein